MQDTIIDITFEYDEIKYTGTVHPSEKLNESGTPASFEVVLNNSLFGNLSFEDCKWVSNEKRPSQLVKQIGRQIEKHYQF
jgi:hypothetical protein